MDSIDQGGVMLKMLHNTLNAKSTVSSQEEGDRLNLNPTTSDTQSAHTEIEDEQDNESIESSESVNGKSTTDKSSNAESSLMDLNESSSASIDSISIKSLQLDDMKDITLSNGRMNTEKVANLPFPSINVSRSLEKSFAAMNTESTKKKKKKGSNDDDTQPPHSTPVSTVTSRKPTRRSKRHADEKEKMNALLKDLNI